MPIVVACPCGTKLRAPDAAAGKRVKCPKCGTPLSVPAAADFEEVEDAPPPVASPAKKKPTPVDADDDAPRPAKKPPVVAARAKPARVEADDADTPKTKRRRDEDEEPPKTKRRRDDDEDDTPKKGKGKPAKAKSKLPLILGVVIGGVVLLGLAGVVVGIILSSNGQASAATNQGTGTRVVVNPIPNPPNPPNGGNPRPTTPAPPTPLPSLPDPVIPPGWSEFKGEGFSVAVPDSAGFGQDKSGGTNVRVRTYRNGHAGPGRPNTAPVSYLVTVSPMTPSEVEAFQKSPKDGWEMLREDGKIDKNLKDEKSVQLGGLEGRHFTLTIKPVNAIFRGVYRDGKLYNLMVTGTKGIAEDSPDVKQFFDSFRLK